MDQTSISMFSTSKNDVKTTLEKLAKLTSTLPEAFDVGDDIKKIQEMIKTIDEEQLKIALFGAFSDGKTSVIAAWLRQKFENMQITSEESTNTISTYKCNLPNGESCVIVDTPGLFGEKQNDVGNGNFEKYEEVTKKFISSAHLIFYVVDAVNPLKDSQGDVVKWLLSKDGLNKISNTIFVINKMDNVAELDEDKDYKEQSIIKIKYLKDQIRRITGLDESSLESLKVVCVAAAPNGDDFSVWSKEEYERYSRIDDLKNSANDVIQSAGKENLIKSAGISVVVDILSKKIEKGENLVAIQNQACIELKNSLQRLSDKLDESKKEILEFKAPLKENLKSLERSKLDAVDKLTLESVDDFIENEIGFIESKSGDDDVFGYRLVDEINECCNQIVENCGQVIPNVRRTFEIEIGKCDDFVESAIGMGLKTIGNGASSVAKMPIKTIKDSVFAVRSTFGKVGYWYKFKPWGATKLAKNISGTAEVIGPIVTIATEVFDFWKKSRDEKKLNEIKKNLKDYIQKVFLPIYRDYNNDNKFLEIFAPQLEEMRKAVEELKTNFDGAQRYLEELQENIRKLKELQPIFTEYEVLD